MHKQSQTKKQAMSQSEAVNEMNLCGRIGVRLFLLNTLCWFSPWELMKTDYELWLTIIHFE